MTITDTFVRALAAGFYRIIHAGEWAGRLNMVVSGLLPDMLCEATRQGMRWTLPIGDTPQDVIPHLLYHFGLPSYEELYAASLARLQNAWPTHENAGSTEQLESQTLLGGLTDSLVLPGIFGHTFYIETTDAGAVPDWGSGFAFGDGTLYGEAIDPMKARNVLRAMRYFRPAGSRFLGFGEPT